MGASGPRALGGVPSTSSASARCMASSRSPGCRNGASLTAFSAAASSCLWSGSSSASTAAPFFSLPSSCGSACTWGARGARARAREAHKGRCKCRQAGGSGAGACGGQGAAGAHACHAAPPALARSGMRAMRRPPRLRSTVRTAPHARTPSAPAPKGHLTARRTQCHSPRAGGCWTTSPSGRCARTGAAPARMPPCWPHLGPACPSAGAASGQARHDAGGRGQLCRKSRCTTLSMAWPWLPGTARLRGQEGWGWKAGGRRPARVRCAAAQGTRHQAHATRGQRACAAAATATHHRPVLGTEV